MKEAKGGDLNRHLRKAAVSAGMISIVAGFSYVGATNPHLLILMIGFVACSMLGFFVHSRNPTNAINRRFLYMALCMAIWYFHLLGLCFVHVLDVWNRTFGFGLLFIPATILYFVLALTGSTSKGKLRLAHAAYGVSFIFVILDIGGLFGKKFVKTAVQYFPVFGPVYRAFVGYLLLTVGYSLFIVWKKYRSVLTTTTRNQLGYFFLAILGALLLGCVNFLPSAGIMIYPVGNLSIVVFVSIVAYAIVRHQLMDIEVIVRKGIIYIALTASLTAIYAVIVGAAYGVFGVLRGPGSLLVNVVAAMVIAFSFQPLRAKVQKGVDRVFFKDKPDYQAALRRISRELSAKIDLNYLTSFIVNSVAEIMHIEKGCLLLGGEENSGFTIEAGRGLEAGIIKKTRLMRDGYLVRELQSSRRRLLKEEIEARRDVALSREERPDPELEEALRQMEELKSVVVIPLVSRDDLVGIFSLGEKKSEDRYTQEDLGLLLTVANQAAVAIENAILHRDDKLVALGRVTSEVAHEIGKPLTPLAMLSEALPERFEDEEFREKYIETVPRLVRRLGDMLNRLRNFGKERPPQFRSLDVHAGLDEVMMLVEAQAARQGVVMIKEYGRDTPRVWADRDLLREAFVNIVSNAMEAMPGGGEMRIKTVSALSPGGDRSAEVHFTDTGCGIPEGDLSELFKPFFTTKREGTGLGLSLSKGIIKDHRGEMDVKSAVGKGTTFVIRLPAAPDIQEDEVTGAAREGG